MIPLQNKTIEEKALHYFLTAENTAKAFKKHLESEGLKITIQGIYKSLNKLLKEEVLVKNKKKFSVSREWIERLITELGGTDQYIDLKDGESILYSFETLNQLDAYWKHIIASINREYPEDPMFFYEPHEIWIFQENRGESQEYFLKNLNKNKRQGFMRIGGNTSGDMEYKKRFQGEFLQIDTSDKKPIDNFMTVVGDYLITTKLPRKTLEQIENIFSKNLSWENMRNTLGEILDKKQKVKFYLEKNKEKAKKYRKKIAENFYVPQDLIKKYDLF